MDVTSQPVAKEPSRLFEGIAQFAIKTVIVCAAIVVSGIVLLDYLDDFITRRVEQMETRIKPLTSIGGTQFWSKLERELENQADPSSDISPEKKRKILSQIRTISDRWRPFLSEAASTIAGDAGAPPRQQ